MGSLPTKPERPGADDAPTAEVETRDEGDTRTTVDARELGGGDDQAPTLAPGEIAGRYVIVERIGAGGMGVVYKAYDPALDRRIALKLLRIAPRSGETRSRPRARLLREAQALAQLAHPNVISVFDVGTIEDDVFVAMELVEGKTLREWVRAAARTQTEILSVLIAAGRGLAAAHAAGMVHRDFKPENVMIGNDGRVRVLDFGLARAVDVDTENDTDLSDSSVSTSEDLMATGEKRLSAPLTRVGMRVGTPSYMAPEQHKAGRVDALSDQFSFCVVLYEALYGAKPFAGPTDRELTRHICEGQVAEPPPGRGVSGALRRVLLRGLSPKRRERFPSMEELLTTLERSAGRSRRRARAAVAFAAALAVFSFGVWYYRDARASVCTGADARLAGVWDSDVKQRIEDAFEASGRPHAPETFVRTSAAIDAYAKRWSAMRKEACEATRVRGEQSDSMFDLRMRCLDRRLAGLRAFTDLLAHEKDPELVDQALKAALSLAPVSDCGDAEWLEAAVPLPDDRAARKAITEVRARLEKAMALHAVGQYQKALAVLEELVRQAESLDYAPLLAEVLDAYGDVQFSSGDLKASEVTFRRAAREAARGKDDRLYARTLIGLLWILREEPARHAELDSLVEMAENAVTRAGSTLFQRARLANAIGSVYSKEGKYEKAREELERSVGLYEKLYGKSHPNLASTLNNLGEAYRHLGRFDEARAEFERAIDVLESAYGPLHPDVAAAISNLGATASGEGKYEEAIKYLERALTIEQQSLGPEHPRVAATLLGLGGMYNMLGRNEEGVPLIKRAIAIQQKTLGPEHPELAMSLHNLGTLLNGMGRSEEAYDDFKRAAEILTKALGPEHPYVAYPEIGMADALAAQHKYEECLPHAERALEIEEKTLEADHPDLAFALISLGRCQLGVGHTAAAVGFYERAVALREKRASAPADLADARFGLAEAIWETGRDRQRAIHLVEQARDAYAEAGEDSAKDLAAARTWLKERERR